MTPLIYTRCFTTTIPSLSKSRPPYSSDNIPCAFLLMTRYSKPSENKCLNTTLSIRDKRGKWFYPTVIQVRTPPL